jgi:hypothetical protein
MIGIQRKRDAGDAHVLADMVRTDSHQRGPPTWGGHAGDDRVAFIDTRDVAGVAAAILVEGPGIADTVRVKAPFPSEASWWRGDRAASCPRMARRLRLAGEAEVWAGAPAGTPTGRHACASRYSQLLYSKQACARSASQPRH